jgi:hypothetical protein
MRMQEPEQQQPLGQEWQASQENQERQQPGAYSAEYTGYAGNAGRYEPEQQEYSERVAGDTYQQEKIHPQEERRLYATVLGVLSIILSSIGFFLAVAGIVASAIVLKYANGKPELLTGGSIGLGSSIGVVLVCVGIFVTAVIVLALRSRRVRGRRWARGRV